MKNKKLMKAISIVLIALTVIMAVVPVFAAGDLSEWQTGTESGPLYDKTKTILKIALGVAQVIAIAVAVIMLIVLAIKYISAAPEGKADIKKTAVQYIVGAVLLFGASGILQIIKNFADTNINNG